MTPRMPTPGRPGESRRAADWRWLRGAAKNAWLYRSADALRARSEEILEANARDVAAAPGSA